MRGGFQWLDSFRFSLSGASTAVLPLVKWLDVSEAREAHVLVVIDDLTVGASDTLTVNLVTCPVVSEETTSYVTCDSADYTNKTNARVASNLSAMRLATSSDTWMPPQGVLGLKFDLDGGAADGLVEAFVVLKY